MAPSSKLLFALCLLISLLFSEVSSSGDLDMAVEGWMMPSVRSECKGTVAECMENKGEEFELGSESNTRMLARRHLSVDALVANKIPCKIHGLSYYSNCQVGAPVNPPHRDCNHINLCRH